MLLGLSLLVTGCAGPGTPAQASRTAQAPATPAVVDRTAAASVPLARRQQRAINRLLSAATASLARQELTTPEERSALVYFRQVLKIDPDNPEAQRGLEKIVQTYIEWADAAMQKGQASRATLFLQRARSVDPESPTVTAAERRLSQVARSAAPHPGRPEDPAFRPLDRRQLAGRAPELQAALAVLADEVRELDSRIQILAPDDRQGRWIYQQLNNRHESYRIRASLLISQQPGVRLLDY